MVGADRVRVLAGATKFMARQKVGDIHVGRTDYEVVCTIMRGIKKKAPVRKRENAPILLAYLTYAIMVHHHNRTFYQNLMSGRF